MSAANQLFPAMEVRDAIGQLAEGREIDPRLMPFVRAAVTGLCKTSDRGEQQFVVDVSGAGSFNVDTEELIWPRAPGDDIRDDVPLRALTDRGLWEQARCRWDEHHPRE